MVFNDIDILAKLSCEEKKSHFGTSVRKPKKIYKHRSNMMLNPLHLNHLNRLNSSQADVITLNLEDAIAPTRKKEALFNIALFLSNLKDTKSAIVVRVNPLEFGGDEEIKFLNDFSFDAIRLSKAKSAKDVEAALKLLDADKALHLSLETKEAFLDIKSLKIDHNVTTLNLGILDLLASLNLPQSLLHRKNPTIDYILSKFLVDCKCSDMHPVSFMYQDYNNSEEFIMWCEYEKNMGFTSKACMGPKQVAIANSIFSLCEQEKECAEYIKEIFEKNAANNINGFMDIRYGFIDEPIYKDALNILQQI